LKDRGVDGEELLRPVAAAATEAKSEKGGLVILRAPSLMQIHRVASVRPIVRVDEHFDVRTLLNIAAERKLFYILALSQNRTRILKCTQDRCEEIPFPAGFPTSLEDAMQTSKPDHDLENRSSGGPSIGSGKVLFGTSSDKDAKDEYMLHFFEELDKAVKSALKDSGAPLVPVGVEQEIALYRRVNTYPHLAEPGVPGAPDGLEGGEMHRRAVEMLKRRAEEPGREVPGDFDKRVGTGHASTNIQEIVAGAYEGRVSHFFFQAKAEYLGAYDPVRQRVKHTGDPLDSPVDLVETAAFHTIRQGGEAKILPGSAMPNGVPVCALFRYPAAQNTAEAT
jgi:hypothetical protein